MKEQFKKYLIKNGYSEFTPSGNPSTVYDYVKRIERIMSWEHYEEWSDVVKNIDKLCEDYSEHGIKSHLGTRSNSAVINALRRFKEFLEEND